MNRFNIIFCVVMVTGLLVKSGPGQNNVKPGGFWNQVSLNGAIGLEGIYRSQQSILKSNISEDLQTSLIRGQMLLRSRSYLWHPSLLLLDADLEYQPGAGRYQYLVAPDRSESVTAERARVQATLFDQRPVTVGLSTNINHSFSNRELLTNIETFKTDWGGILQFRNRMLPLTLRYLQENWTQKELEIAREFKNYREMFQAQAGRSFTGRDFHQLILARSNFQREYGNADKIYNTVTDVNLRDRFFFNKNQSSSWHSYIWYYDQEGTQNFDRLQLTENLTFQLPWHFTMQGRYQYFTYQQQLFDSRQHTAGGQVAHQLFLSLNSHLLYEYSQLRQSQFDENIRTAEIGVNYRKKIPAGLLTISYDVSKRVQDHLSTGGERQIVNEEKRLEDGQPVLLNNPLVEINSVVVYNSNRTIIYQLNIDYVLIVRGDYLEIQRLPGGQIGSGDAVYVDYLIRQQDSYRFDCYNNNFYIQTAFLNNLLELYFRYFDQDYDQVETTSQRILNEITQQVFGVRSTIRFISVGMEMDNFQALIVPYESRRYYLNLSHYFLRRVNLLLSASYRDYRLTAEDERQLFTDMSGRLTYTFRGQSRLTLEGGYRLQDGRGIDLDLRTFRGDISTFYRKIVLSVGIETFRRDFIGEIINYAGTYIRVTRQF